MQRDEVIEYFEWILNSFGDIIYIKKTTEDKYLQHKYWKKITFYYTIKRSISYKIEHSFNDNPSSLYEDGAKYWAKDGLFHRETRPAIILDSNTKKYYYNGEYIDVKTDKEFKQYIKMKVFI
jgi:hypothetical protein